MNKVQYFFVADGYLKIITRNSLELSYPNLYTVGLPPNKMNSMSFYSEEFKRFITFS